MMLQIRSSCLI
uniref:Uncharacterized protein n=1 Tax=Arundo donax TaxID=35708 RepID=A0A0A9GSL2_ARUDO